VVAKTMSEKVPKALSQATVLAVAVFAASCATSRMTAPGTLRDEAVLRIGMEMDSAVRVLLSLGATAEDCGWLGPGERKKSFRVENLQSYWFRLPDNTALFLRATDDDPPGDKPILRQILVCETGIGFESFQGEKLVRQLDLLPHAATNIVRVGMPLKQALLSVEKRDFKRYRPDRLQSGIGGPFFWNVLGYSFRRGDGRDLVVFAGDPRGGTPGDYRIMALLVSDKVKDGIITGGLMNEAENTGIVSVDLDTLHILQKLPPGAVLREALGEDGPWLPIRDNPVDPPDFSPFPP
jgi:hypothetical protein